MFFNHPLILYYVQHHMHYSLTHTYHVCRSLQNGVSETGGLVHERALRKLVLLKWMIRFILN